MTMLSLHYFPPDEVAARKLAEEMNIASHAIKLHHFPDGESKIQVEPDQGNAIIYISLDDPDRKLIQLSLAASALRDTGSRRLILVAPYLCYMRQDKAFHRGEAISQRVVGKYLSTIFDRVVTVDPHLHRILELQEVFPDCQADSLSATGPISAVLKQKNDLDKLLLIGPDSEAEQWVKVIATKTCAPYLVGEKIRHGDRSVTIELPAGVSITGIKAIIVDDVISSGMTIIRCAEKLIEAGAATVEVMATHILCSDEDLEMIKNAGVSDIASTDSLKHSTNSIPLAPMLANALKGEH